jgi:hypothetical protein
MATLQRYIDELNLWVNLPPIATKKATRLVPRKNAPNADRVYTPRELAAKIIQRLPLSGDVLDPCKGDGTFYDQFPKGVESHWCELDDGRDFLHWEQPVN